MTRQIDENILNKKLLTAREAQIYLGIGRYSNFKLIVDKGEIGFKLIGRSKYFTIQELERWLAKPNYHTEYTSAVMSSTHTTPLSLKTDKGYSLEKQLEELRLKKLKDIASKGLQSCKKRLVSKHQENCPA